MRPLILNIVAAALVSTLAIPAMAADCTKPGVAPTLPKGETATKDDMLKGKSDLQKYVNGLQAFQDCMEKKISDNPKEKQNVRQAWRDQGNAAIDEATAEAAAYSAELKAYNAKAH